ncbi:unnamed protein product, partial [Didymodactylos carnosus]
SELTNAVDNASPHSWLTAATPVVEPLPVLTPSVISQPPPILLEPSELVDSVSLILNQLHQQTHHQHIESVSEYGDNMDEDDEYGDEGQANKVSEQEKEAEAITVEEINPNVMVR